MVADFIKFFIGKSINTQFSKFGINTLIDHRNLPLIINTHWIIFNVINSNFIQLLNIYFSSQKQDSSEIMTSKTSNIVLDGTKKEVGNDFVRLSNLLDEVEKSLDQDPPNMNTAGDWFYEPPVSCVRKVKHNLH